MNVSPIIRKLARLVLGFLPLAYVAFIWYLSSHPSDAVVNLGTHDAFIKEALHLIEYGLLYGLIIFTLYIWGKLNPRTARLALIAAIACAFADELHQFYVPARSATLNDLLKDILGIFAARYLLRLVGKPRIK